MKKSCKLGLTFAVALMLLIFASAGEALAANYYVSTTGSDGNSGSQASPFKTIGKAASIANAGDTVYVNNGTYVETVTIQRSGTSTAWIVFQSVNPHGAKVAPTGTGSGDDAFNINGQNYIEVEGFETTSGPNAPCIFSGGGHHTMVLNNLVHDCGGSGIQLNYGDYRTIQGNIVYRAAFYSTLCGSGIGIYEPVASDSAGGFHNIISANITYQNDNLAGAQTDGEGITLDDFQYTQNPGTPYTHATLIETNLSYDNGGPGIHLYYSDYATIRNNTVYWNNQRVNQYSWRGELWDGVSSNNIWVNNIAWTDPGADAYNTAILDAESTNNVWANNLTYNGTPGQASLNITDGSTSSVTAASGNLLGVNPLQVSPGIYSPDFQLQATSPAINAGTSAYGISSTDLDGNPRLVGSAVDIGAYEYQGAGTQSSKPLPFGGSAHGVPGTVQAEYYDLGGEGVAYHDVNNGNQTDFRTDNIGVYADSSASDGYAVGWNIAGEWMGYTINVANAATYNITARVASGIGPGTFHLEFGPVGQIGGAGITSTGECTINNTGGWGGSAYQIVTVPGVALKAGMQWMRLVKDSGPYGWVGNIDYLSFAAQ